jgi:hypothetical protein
MILDRVQISRFPAASAGIFVRTVRGAALVASMLSLAGCFDSGNDAPGTAIENTNPVANAGPNQPAPGQPAVVTSVLVTLNGSGSSDANGDPLNYDWLVVTRPVGSTAALSSTTVANPTFTPDVAGAYVFRLTVDDGFGTGTSSDEVTVTAIVPPTLPPVADAGADQTLSFTAPSTTVNLDGSASSDPNPGDTLTFSWVITNFDGVSPIPPAVPVTLVGANTATPSFDVTDIDQLGTYTLTLTVSDGVLSDTDTVDVTVDKSMPAASVLFSSGVFGTVALALANRWRKRKQPGKSNGNDKSSNDLAKGGK